MKKKENRTYEDRKRENRTQEYPKQKCQGSASLTISRKNLCEGILLLFLLIPFFRPDLVSEMPRESAINRLFIWWRVLAFLIIAARYGLEFLKRPQFDICLLLIGIYELELLYSSVIHQELVKERIIDIANFFGIYFLYQCYGRQYPRLFIKINYCFFSFLVWINAFLTVLFPRGLNHAADNSARINFLGKDNTITLVFILTIVFCALYHNLNPRSPSAFLTTAAILAMQLYYRSGSGVVATLVIIAYLWLVSGMEIVNRLLKPGLMFAVYMVLEIVIVFLNEISFLGPLFRILNKASTFTDRRYYWMSAFYQLAKTPVFGQGSGITFLWDNNYYSHNSFLDILLKGGIVGAVLWCLMIFVIMKSLKLKENLRIQGFLVCCFFAFLLVGLMEGLEERIAFNAFLGLIPAMGAIERSGILRNRLVDPGIRIRSRIRIRLKQRIRIRHNGIRSAEGGERPHVLYH